MFKPTQLIPYIDLPWRPDEKDRRVAVKIHCDNPSCKNEVKEHLPAHGWYELKEDDSFVSYHPDGGPWNLCSLDCVEQWAATRRNQ